MVKNEPRRGLLLEGGAARGAYEVGVYRQLWLNGRRYQVVVGVSVGAINGASFVQSPRGVEAQKIWQRLDYSKVLGEGVNLPEEQRFIALPLLRQLVSQRGISLEPLRRFLSEIIDERAVRASPIDYGLTTLVAGELRSLRLFKEQIAVGELLTYILASASLPVFRVHPVQNRYLLDGGLGDALPISMLVKRGCTCIDVVRTAAIKPMWPRLKPEVELFVPSVPLPPCYDFRPSSIQKSMRQGELDAQRVLKGWGGRRYYLRELAAGEELFFRLPERVKCELLGLFNLPVVSVTRGFFSLFLPHMFRLAGLGPEALYLDLLVSALELTAQHYALERLQVYALLPLMRKLATAGEPPPKPSSITRQASLLLPSKSRHPYLVYFGWCCCTCYGSK